MKYFNHSIIAKGYQNKKPYFHPIVINKIKEFIKIDKKLKNVLDVGCGTGLSTVALKAIAKNIIGVDASKEMILLSKKEKNIQYFNYTAEELPFKNNTFDLITLAGSINWIDRNKFFKIASNILLLNRYLIIYDNYFLGQMKNNRDFENWYNNIFLKKYPKPQRNEDLITKKESEKYGFNFIHDEKYTNEIKFSLEEFIDYLITLTNIAVIIERDNKKIPEIKNWLKKSLKNHFYNSKQVLIFDGYIWYLQNKKTA